MKTIISHLCISVSLCVLLLLPVTPAQAFQESDGSRTDYFNPKPIGGQSMSMIYSSKSEPSKYIAAYINLNFFAGQGAPHVDAFEIRMPQRSIQVYANNGQPYVHFFEKGACYPNPQNCRQSTIPETDFVPFKGSEFRGPIEAKIEETPEGRRFMVKMQNNDNILIAVDLESMQVTDGIVTVDDSKPTPIRRHASWLPGVKCRQGLTCYERFHRAGLDQLTRGKILWADGSVQMVDDRSMSQEPDHDALYKLGHQRVWKATSEAALPGFQHDRRSRLVFADSHATRFYTVGTLDFLRTFEKSVRNRMQRPRMGQYYGYSF
jgi:hypothetical protein